MKTLALGSMALLASTIVLAGLATPLAAAPDGATLFQQRCAACHTVMPAAASGVGPNLSGVVGRKAGSVKYNYSAALKASAMTWNAANLDSFLAAPKKVVPGTKMMIMMPDPVQRKAIIDYLARAK